MRLSVFAPDKADTDDFHVDASAVVAGLERALKDDRLRRRLIRVIIEAISCQVEERLYRRILPRVLDSVAAEKILIHRETRPLGLSHVSFSSAVPDWEQQLSEYLLDLIGPTLDKIFTRKRKGKP